MQYRVALSGITFLMVLGLSPPGKAGETKVAWKQTASLPAVEANQAAAADEDFVYAITDNQVAKYDRKTQKRVGVSKGPAKHLNSGFLWEGRLYCAHSNYPLTPEESQIMVLHPKRMELTTFKDFGNYGGSLTWAVRHEGHWWCNFAKYADDNAKTFLVQLDGDWKEKGRWTYPKEVLGKLGRYSLSGGIWRDGVLLVTGHDDPVFFRLGLPKEGTVLEYLGKESAPFTGQGFAHDPGTGGLVGIQRGKRLVVFAEKPKE